MPAHLHHISVFVKDMKRALDLFNGVLGMTIVQRVEGVRGRRISSLLGIAGFQGDLVFLKHPAQRVFLELVHQTHPSPGSRPSRSADGLGLSLTVPDLAATHAALRRAGWRPLSEPLDMVDPSGRPISLFCFHTDEGMMVELIQQAA